MATEKLEALSKSTNPQHPRVSLEDLENNIVDVEIVEHISKSGKVLRWAILTVKNGTAVVGDPSVSASKENDNESLGTQRAIEKSRLRLWDLMAYALAEKKAGI